MEDIIAQLASALCVGIGLAIGIVAAIAVAKQLLFIGRPNEILIFSGRQRKLADGSSVGYRELIGGGRSFRIPVFEKVERMDLSTLPIDIKVSGAYSRGNIPLHVHAVANVKISADPVVVKNAIERFLGRDLSEVRRVAKETLEGHLRGVLATLTPEEVNEDRLKFANALSDEAGEDFHKLGLVLDTLKIQNVWDDTNYLDSIGRKRIAEVIRDAEIAESLAKAEAQEVESVSHREGAVAVQNAQTTIVRQENALTELKASLEAEARSEEETAEAAAQEAKATAEAELQEIRKQLEQVRLNADLVLPAQAQREGDTYKARGDAADIEENGRAMAGVLQLMTDAWLKAGDDARDIFLIQQLEDVLRTVVSRIQGLQVEDVTLLDSGDGQALAHHVASFPATVRQVLKELHTSTGVDVTGILAGIQPTAPQEVK